MKQLEDILKGCIQKDSKAQQLLFNNYKSLFMAVALRYVGEREMAKDVVQESFVKVFKQLHSLKEPGAFESWSRRIVVNTALNEIKKNANRQNIHTQVAGDDFRVSHNPELEIIRKIDNQVLMELIESMPEGYRAVFNMYLIDGFSHSEIAEMLEITESTSRSQLTKAKRYFYELVDKLEKKENERAVWK